MCSAGGQDTYIFSIGDVLHVAVYFFTSEKSEKGIVVIDAALGEDLHIAVIQGTNLQLCVSRGRSRGDDLGSHLDLFVGSIGKGIGAKLVDGTFIKTDSRPQRAKKQVQLILNDQVWRSV